MTDPGEREPDEQGLRSWAEAVLRDPNKPVTDEWGRWYRHAALKLADKGLASLQALTSLQEERERYREAIKPIVETVEREWGYANLSALKAAREDEVYVSISPHALLQLRNALYPNRQDEDR